MRALLLALLLARTALAGPATRALGVERWRLSLTSPLLAQPAISASGRIALLTAGSLRLVDADGKVEAELTDLAHGPASQPFWSGDTLWFRSENGWKSWANGTEGPECPTGATSGAVDAGGQAVFADSGGLFTCAPGKTRLFTRHGDAAQVWPLAGGWFLADDWYLESFTPAGASRGGGLVTNLGFPAGVSASEELIVATPAGGVAALDATVRVRWRGPRGLDGPPVTTRSGATVLLADRTVFLADPPLVSWALPVPAGVRAAAALDDGSVLVLERTGHLGLVREGRVVWSKRLENSGNILAAHPAGFALVQDGANVVAVNMPGPDLNARQAVTLGLARDGRAPGKVDRTRCPAPPPGRLKGKSLHVDGFAVADEGACRYPSLDVPIAGTPGKQLFRITCGEECRAAAGQGRVVVSDVPGRVDELDRKGKRKTLRKSGEKLAALGVDAAHLYTLAEAKLGVAPLGRAVVVDGTLAGLDANGHLWMGSDDRELKRFELSRGPAVEPSIAAFGPMVCGQGAGRLGCFAEGQLLPARVLNPHLTWFGERLERCPDPTALCLASEGAPLVPVWKSPSPIADLVSLGDGTVAVLAGGRVTDLWPDGSVRWEVVLSDDAAQRPGERWLMRASASLLVARSAGFLAGIDTGLRN